MEGVPRHVDERAAYVMTVCDDLVGQEKVSEQLAAAARDADALVTADPRDAGAQALRWELEELRVQLFAQELGVKGGVSPKRLAARLERLRSI